MEETKVPSPIPTPQSKRRLAELELLRKWKWSPWRIVPLPVSAYIVTGAYLWSIGTPEAWLRAIGPVLTVGTFVVVGPLVRNWWFREERKKLLNALEEPHGTIEK